MGEININETNIEVTETELQTHTTSDGVAVTLSLGLKFRIKDLRRMYVNIHDPIDTLSNQICSAVGRCITSMPYAELSKQLAELVTREIYADMEEWGIEVVNIDLINLVQARPLRLIMDRNSTSQRFK